MARPVVILAGGKGTRIEPHAEGLPKALIPVNGRPFLHWKLEQLREAGATHAIISTGFRGTQVYDYVADFNHGISLALVPDGPEVHGTLSALVGLLPFIAESHLVLTYGDNLLQHPLSELLEIELDQHESLMVVTEQCGPSDRYNTRLNDERIECYQKSDSDGILNTLEYGYSVLSVEALSDQVYSGQSDMEAYFSREAELGRMSGLLTQASYVEIGTKAGLDMTGLSLKHSPSQ